MSKHNGSFQSNKGSKKKTNEKQKTSTSTYFIKNKENIWSNDVLQQRSIHLTKYKSKKKFKYIIIGILFDILLYTQQEHLV